MSIISEIRDIKATGDFEAAWQKGFPALQQDPGNTYLQTSLFWVIYSALKQLIEPITARENIAPTTLEKKQIDFWASRISTLQITLPNELIDFRLWNLFRGIGKFCEPICLFILRSGRSIFSSNDYEPFKTEKGESPSLVTRLAHMVAANYLQQVGTSQLDPARVIALLKHAQECAKDSPQGKVWLDYDMARIFKAAGRIDKAREAYSSVLKRKGGESWAWFGLASTYLDDPKKAIALTAFGLTCAHDPKFSIPGLVQMAELLAETGDHEYASKVLIKLCDIYNQNGWQLKDKVVGLTSSAWFDGSLNTKDLDAYIAGLAVGANEVAMADPTYFSGVVQSVHESGKGAFVYVDRSQTFSVRKGVFPNRRIPSPGTYIRILCDMGSDSKDVSSAESIAPFDSPDINSFRGEIRVTDRGFGFVNNDLFVPPGMCEGITTGTIVAGIAVMSYDKAKEKYGWKAITIRQDQAPS